MKRCAVAGGSPCAAAAGGRTMPASTPGCTSCRCAVSARYGRRLPMARAISARWAHCPPSGTALLDYAERHGARLLVIDPAGLAIATNENDRALVSMALDALAGWALGTGCAVLITGHPAKAREGEAADYSGSTAWRGSVRALWTLRAPDADDADRDSTEWARLVGSNPARAERVALLTRNKNNYGWDGDALTLATCGARAGWYLAGPVTAPKGGARKAKGAGTATDPNEHAKREALARGET